MNDLRDFREVIREEPYMRRLILEFCEAEGHTVPEIAEKLGRPNHEAMFWVMGMRRYGWIRELKDATSEGYFRYQAVAAEARA
jgi:hypothetical protein